MDVLWMSTIVWSLFGLLKNEAAETLRNVIYIDKDNFPSDVTFPQ